jgi:hypothetical protein
MSITKKVLIATGIVVLIAVICGGVGIYLLTRSPEMKEEMRPVEADIEVEQSFERKLAVLEEEIKAAVAAGEQREVTLTLTEAEVSIMLSEMMREAMTESSDDFSEEMVIDTVVNLDEDGIRAVVKMEVYGVKVSAGTHLRAVVDEEGLSLEMEKLEIGQLSFIGSIEDRIKNKFNESHTHIGLDDLHIDLEKGLPVELKDLIIEGGEMVIIGVTR